MKKKKNEWKKQIKKKKKRCRGVGYCPFTPCVSHDTVDCIVTQKGVKPCRLSHDKAGLSYDTAERKAAIRQRVGATRPAARARGLAG